MRLRDAIQQVIDEHDHYLRATPPDLPAWAAAMFTEQREARVRAAVCCEFELEEAERLLRRWLARRE